MSLGANVCVLLAAREPFYTELHNFKVVNYELQELPPLEAAHLFLKRVHRPLTLRDLGDGESELPIVIAKENRRTVLEKLASHPVMQDLAGHWSLHFRLTQKPVVVSREVGLFSNIF